MIEDSIVNIMSAFQHIDDKFESIKLLNNAKMIDITRIKDYGNIVHHLMANSECNDDIDSIAKGLVSTFGPYMAAYNENTEEVSTLYDFVADGMIDLISEYGIIVRNDFLTKLEQYGCKSIVDLPEEICQIILRPFDDEEEM